MILDGTGARLITFAVDTVTVVQGGPEVRFGPLWLRGQLPEDGCRTHQGLCLYQGSEFFFTFRTFSRSRMSAKKWTFDGHFVVLPTNFRDFVEPASFQVLSGLFDRLLF